jgi:hypothetical protein
MEENPWVNSVGHRGLVNELEIERKSMTDK